MLTSCIGFTNYWLSYWTTNENGSHPRKFIFYLGIYIASGRTCFFVRGREGREEGKEGVIFIYFYLSIYLSIYLVFSASMSACRAFSSFRFCTNSGERLHNRLFAGLLRAPMWFFDMYVFISLLPHHVRYTNIFFLCSTPLGRILNRFSRVCSLPSLPPSSLLPLLSLSPSPPSPSQKIISKFLAYLKYLKEECGSNWSAETCAMAAQGGHVDCLQYHFIIFIIFK
jgi:hypothetical protein